MSYDTPMRVTYSWTAQNIGAGNITRRMTPPKGMRGKIVHVSGVVTTSFVGTTTPGRIQVGDGVTANRFCDLPFGAAGAGTAAGAAVTAKDQASGLTGLIPGAHRVGAVDQDLILTLVAPTGGAPAGVADVFAVVEWF